MAVIVCLCKMVFFFHIGKFQKKTFIEIVAEIQKF